MVRWNTVKGLTALILFILASVLVEYLVVTYAVSLGVEDPNPLQWSLQFPGTSWKATVTVSLLFHIVPLTVIIALTFSWVCLTNYLALSAPKTPEEKFRRIEKRKKKLKSRINRAVKNSLNGMKAALMKSRRVAYVWSGVSRAKTIVKSSLIMLFAFLLILFLLSLLAYPRLFLKLYINIPSTLEFVMSMGNAARVLVETLAPIGWACAVVNNAIVVVAPSLRAFTVSFWSLIKPLAGLPPAGKYLFLQNFAVWVSDLAVLFYGLYVRKGYRYRRIRKG